MLHCLLDLRYAFPQYWRQPQINTTRDGGNSPCIFLRQNLYKECSRGATAPRLIFRLHCRLYCAPFVVSIRVPKVLIFCIALSAKPSRSSDWARLRLTYFVITSS